jgi:hypothetical protein
MTPSKQVIVRDWIKENFPLSTIKEFCWEVKSNPAPWCTIGEGNALAEIDFNPYPEFTDDYFYHIRYEMPKVGVVEPVIANIADPQYFTILKSVLIKGGLTPKENLHECTKGS